MCSIGALMSRIGFWGLLHIVEIQRDHEGILVVIVPTPILCI